MSGTRYLIMIMVILVMNSKFVIFSNFILFTQKSTYAELLAVVVDINGNLGGWGSLGGNRK